jgi:thioredoxin reductase (NADPH)
MIKEKPSKVIDLLIIGGGPAGLTSAIYGGRAMINTLLLENGVMGGQIRNTYRIENYPGFIEITGEELTSRMMEQAEKSGAVIDEFDEIVSIKFSDEEKIIETASAIYKPLAVIITSGAKHRSLPIAEEPKYYGKGIHYCELCDGFMYKDKNIIVVGGGNSAAEAAIYLSRYANNITLIHRRESIKTEKSIQDELYGIPKIKYMWDSEIVSAYGEKKLEGVSVQNLKTQEIIDVKIDGIFVYVGMLPQSELFKDSINVDEQGYILAGESTETNIKGVFAAGDIRKKQFRQVSTAVGDGAVASLMAERYITKKRKN